MTEPAPRRPPAAPAGKTADKRGDFYTYYSIRNEVGGFEQFAHGAVFNAIMRDTFSGIKKVLPRSELTQRFDSMVGPLLTKVLHNRHQTTILATTRDALLPKLLSGEVRVKEAEAVVGKAV